MFKYVFNKENSTASIKKYTGNEKEGSIPEYTEEEGIKYKITSIGSFAFSGCSSLKNITVPSGVTSIGEDAFSLCSSLTSIIIPSNVTNIGEGAFYGCSSLTSIEIPAGVTSIGAKVFAGCSSLTKISIPSDVTEIEKYAFAGCSSLTSLKIPDRVTRIGKGILLNCSSLINIATPNRVPRIDEDVFYNPSSFTSTIIGNNVESMDWYGFEDCSSLQYNIYDNAKYLGNNDNPYLVLVKSVNKDITSCDINDKCRFIYRNAFSGCSFLTSITLGSGVKSIGNHAFGGCYRLVEICNKANYKIKRRDDIGRYALNIYNPEVGSSKLSIDDGYVVYAGDKDKILIAYRGSLTDLVIPNYITKINQYAFYDCFSLTSIVIPESVTSIGKEVFYNCSSLRSIKIPDSVASIEGYAFYNCFSLKYNIYNNTKYLGNDDNPYLVLIEVLSKDTTEYNINDKCRIIGSSAFLLYFSLKNIVIPDSVISIMDNAFEYCSSLKSITIPFGVTNIGEDAFRNCSSLTINCEAREKPAGWDNRWNPDDRPVNWGIGG